MTTSNLYELLLHQAKMYPEEKALLSVDKTLNFLELNKAVVSIANSLQDLGVKSGQRVSTRLPGHWDWPVTLALSKIGAVSVSAQWDDSSLSDLIDWDISVKNLVPKSEIFGAKILDFDPAWAESSNTSDDFSSWYRFETNEAMRIFLTSGTTGKAKPAVYSFGTLVSKLTSLSKYWNEFDLEFNLMPLGSIGGFSTALGSLVRPSPFIANSAVLSGTLAMIARANVEAITGSPFQIAAMLTALETNQLTLPSLKKVRLAGSFPTQKLRQRLEAFGVSKLESVYGSTECGALFIRDLKDGLPPEYLGEILEGSEVRPLAIKDQNPVLIAETEFEYKTPAMFDGYLKFDGTIELGTVSGWFRPGDRVRNAAGKFLFVGRDGDLVNIGGIIFSAVPLEEFVKSKPGVEDALSFEAEDSLGNPIYALAIVANFEFNLPALEQDIKINFQKNNPSHLMLVSEIPRNQMGKPLRSRLQELFNK